MWPGYLDVSADGSVYVDQIERALDLLRFPISGGAPERLPGSGTGLFTSGVVQNVILLPDGRTLLVTYFSGRARLLVAAPGKDPQPFIETQEETASPATLLSGGHVAFLLGSGAERVIALASVADGRVVRRLTGGKGAPIVDLASSPDGKMLYYVASGNVWALPAGDGQPRRITPGDAVAAHPNGQDLLVKLNESAGVRLVRVPVSGGEPRPIAIRDSNLRLVEPPLAPNSVHSDGRIVVNAAMVNSWFYPPAVLDPRTGKLERIPLAYPGDIFYPGWTNDGRIVAMGLLMRGSMWRFRPVR